MRSFGRIRPLAALVFDIDGTLYSHPGYQRAQIDVQIERLAAERGWSMEEARARVAEAEALAAAGSGRERSSLGNAFLYLGVPMELSVRWREELLRPEDYLSPDPRLARALENLSKTYRLACLTNNPASVGRRTLEALGVQSAFPILVGLDSTLRSKPEAEPFRAVLGALGLPASSCASVGDRYDVDIAPALELGMGGILVEGVEEVYSLKGFLNGEASP
jgi:phosphoglycolate phosphatase/putative hydrolase of the HAD superfamily